MRDANNTNSTAMSGLEASCAKKKLSRDDEGLFLKLLLLIFATNKYLVQLISLELVFKNVTNKYHCFLYIFMWLFSLYACCFYILHIHFLNNTLVFNWLFLLNNIII